MKSLVWLTESILLDSGMRCGADPSMDIRTVRRRTEYEGESFLTITLPNFGSAFDRALASGRLVPSDTPSFAAHRRGLPEFLRGFLLQVFGPNGYLLEHPSPDAIMCVRQICYTHKKVLRECDDTRKRRALDSYVECEHEVGQVNPPADSLANFRAVSRIVWSDLFVGVPFGNPYDELHPTHGPGAVRERIKGNQKWTLRSWHTRLEEEFPYSEFAVASPRAIDFTECGISTQDGPVDFVEPGDELPVRVVFVPKTQKTPRVIAIEPVCMQYMQQAIWRWLAPRIEQGKYTGGRVNFVDQSINGTLALSSSESGRYATIDLSEASDRVSCSLVESMLDVVPDFRRQVMACRSTRAELPDGRILALKKFASMGSALCFPMEAMVFFCAIVAHRIQKAQVPVCAATVHQYSRDVFVYGDDIIIPTDEAPSIALALSLFGLKVNERKSFWTGKFRESCGVDAYDGTDVTPTYARHEQPRDRRDAEALVSWCAMANQLYAKGYWRTVRLIRQCVERITGKLPHLSDRAQGLYWSTYSKAVQYSRWCRDTMSYKVRTWVPVSRRCSDVLDGYQALLKCFRTIGQPLVDLNHLTQSVARGGLTLKRRWVHSI